MIRAVLAIAILFAFMTACVPNENRYNWTAKDLYDVMVREGVVRP